MAKVHCHRERRFADTLFVSRRVASPGSPSSRMTGLSDGTCDSVVRFLCRSNEAVRTELSGPDCDLTHSPLSERVCGESESERASHFCDGRRCWITCPLILRAWRRHKGAGGGNDGGVVVPECPHRPPFSTLGTCSMFTCCPLAPCL